MLHPLPKTFHSLQYSCEGVTGVFRLVLSFTGLTAFGRPKEVPRIWGLHEHGGQRAVSLAGSCAPMNLPRE